MLVASEREHERGRHGHTSELVVRLTEDRTVLLKTLTEDPAIKSVQCAALLPVRLGTFASSQVVRTN